MSDTMELNSGKVVQSKTLFPNPQSNVDARILREVFSRYEINNFDGIILNMQDWNDLSEILFERDSIQTSLSDEVNGNELNPKEIESQSLIIYPDVSSLLGLLSYDDEDEAILSLKLENDNYVIPQEIDIKGVLDQLNSANEAGKERLRQEVLGPILGDRETVQNILEFQIQQGADIALTPSIPITSRQDFSQRIELLENIFRTTNAIADGNLLSKDINIMHTFSIRPSVLRRPETGNLTREEELLRVIRDSDPDIIGIHLNNLDHEHQDRVQSLLDLIREVNDDTNANIFLLNVDEFGLVSFDYGVDVIASPIASSPYPRFSEGSSTQLGSYYHYEDLIPYSRERLLEKTRPEYLFPCYCEICDTFETVTSVDTDYWNEFRRVHYLLVKDKEMKRIRETDKLLRESIRDMVANSKRTDLASYI